MHFLLLIYGFIIATSAEIFFGKYNVSTPDNRVSKCTPDLKSFTEKNVWFKLYYAPYCTVIFSSF